MSDSEDFVHRQQNLYLTEVLELKIACEYTRKYRDSSARWITRFNILRAVASSGAIATWAVVKSYPLIWAGIIAASQVADALKDVIPLTARYRAIHGLVTSLDALLVEALFEAEGVYAGKFTDEEIIEKRHKLMQIRQEIEAKHFPSDSLPRRENLFSLAKEEATAYFDNMFGPRTDL